MVAEFAVPKMKMGKSGKQHNCGRMIVKASIAHDPNGELEEDHHNERNYLHLLASIQPLAPASIPRLVQEPEGQANDSQHRGCIQLGIQPVGCKFDTNVFETHKEFADGMDKLLDGLEWLHTKAKLIYRDVRQANVVYCIDNRTPVLIDYGSAWRMVEPEPHHQTKTFYLGGII